jgi:hypothetical protein
VVLSSEVKLREQRGEPVEANLLAALCCATVCRSCVEVSVASAYFDVVIGLTNGIPIHAAIRRQSALPVQ